MLVRTTSFRMAILAILALAHLCQAQAEPDQASRDRLAKGIAAHDALNAALDSGSAVKTGAIDLEGKAREALALLAPEGWDRPPLALAYHGSVLTLQASMAKRENRLAAALDLLESGTREIDRAVSLDPKGIAPRVLRLENSLGLLETSPVDRKSQVTEDLAFLRAAWSDLQPDAKAVVELDEGRLALHEKRLGDALAAWRKATREAPDSSAAARAKKLLSRYGS